jgi:hypothetical protein
VVIFLRDKIAALFHTKTLPFSGISDQTPSPDLGEGRGGVNPAKNLPGNDNIFNSF